MRGASSAAGTISVRSSPASPRRRGPSAASTATEALDPRLRGGAGIVSDGPELARAAERLVGAPFRLHGRDPARGLDCVGLVLAALETVGRRARVPPYRLRMREIGALVAAASDAGLVEASGPVRPGDVLLVRPGPAQHHLAIAASGGGLVHAHAGLRRVVLTPAPLPWAEERRWRLP